MDNIKILESQILELRDRIKNTFNGSMVAEQNIMHTIHKLIELQEKYKRLMAEQNNWLGRGMGFHVVSCPYLLLPFFT